MKAISYIALLRGINVGGNNLIPMEALRNVFKETFGGEVRTYIQSGNVIFSSPQKDISQLEKKIEDVLARAFSYNAKVVIVSADHMKDIIHRAPDGFGADKEQYRYDVFFLKSPLAAAEVLGEIPAKPGVDRVSAGPGVLYYSRYVPLASQSSLSKLASLKVYREMTIRNWNTTMRLHALLTS